MKITEATVFALATLCVTAAAPAQQTLQSRSASFYRSWAVHPRFELLGYDIDLKETRATLDFYGSTAKTDLRNYTGRRAGAPVVLQYSSYARARAPVSFFGESHELAYVSASAVAAHGIHANDPRYYTQWATRDPRLSKGISVRFFGRNQALPTTTNLVTGAITMSLPKQTSTVYEDTWEFVVPPGIPIAIEGSVDISWSLSATAAANGKITRSYNWFTQTYGDAYMTDPTTSLQLSHEADGYGNCDGIIGIPGLGVGLGHEIHLLSPVRPSLSIWSGHSGMGGSMNVSVTPLIVKSFAVVKYVFGEKKYFFPTLSVATWTPYAKQLF